MRRKYVLFIFSDDWRQGCDVEFVQKVVSVTHFLKVFTRSPVENYSARILIDYTRLSRRIFWWECRKPILFLLSLWLHNALLSNAIRKGSLAPWMRKRPLHILSVQKGLSTFTEQGFWEAGNRSVIRKPSDFSGLEVACWPLVPKFAVLHPAEAVGFLERCKRSLNLTC
jgi:hypothetical protein